MVNQQQSDNRARQADAVHGAGASPMGDQQQATQEKTRDAVESAKERGEHAVDKAQAIGQTAAERAREQADRQMEGAADRMETLAGALRDRGSRLPGGQTTRDVTSAAADRMNQAADFLHDRDTGDMLEKVRAYTRSHPGTALIVAGVAGLFLGRRMFR